MSQNYYSEINLHIVWHTKSSYPFLTADVEPLAHRSLLQKIAATPGVCVYEIGGTETHIHVCLSVSPTIAISEFIGQLKGYSAHEVNRRVGRGQKVLQWQGGYGVVSFGTKDLEWVRSYVRHQREHHAEARTHDRLESFAPADRAEAKREAP